MNGAERKNDELRCHAPVEAASSGKLHQNRTQQERMRRPEDLSALPECLRKGEDRARHQSASTERFTPAQNIWRATCVSLHMRAALFATALVVASPAYARHSDPHSGPKLIAVGAAVLAVGLTLVGVGAWARSSAPHASTITEFNIRKSLSDAWEFGAFIGAAGTVPLIVGAVSTAGERAERASLAPGGVAVRF
jgi:hypothetical protein